MKRLAVFTGAIVVLAGLCLAQNYHDQEYICGGYGPLCTPTQFLPSVYLVRGNGNASTLFVPGGISFSSCMDTDNRKIIFAVGGPGSSRTCQPTPGPRYGIYRYDPGAMIYQTLYGPDTIATAFPVCIHVNQDGDYVFTNMSKTWSNNQWQDGSNVMKVDQRGILTTLFTTIALGRRGHLRQIIRNIDTGKYLVSDGYSQTHPTRMIGPVLELAEDGTFNSWNTGNYGWGNVWSMPQDHGTGYLEGPSGGHIWQVKPGSGLHSLVATVSNGYVYNLYNFKYDLHTAAQKRWIGTPCLDAGVNKTWIANLDRSGSLSSIQVKFPAGRCAGYYTFDFYRGNHIATMKTGKDRWDILLSCPRSPGMQYALAATLSGVRPGIPLPDGRRLDFNPDSITQATLNGWLPGIWSSGPLVLDSSGEAKGYLDLSSLSLPPGGIGVPVWIAMVVLDGKAPLGIKYMPDTIVIRI